MKELNKLQVKNNQFRRNLIQNYQKQQEMPSVFFAPGVLALYESNQELFYKVIQEVITFPDEKFTEDNDPHQEHDMTFFEVDGERYFFKIDYYDTSYQYHCGTENMLNDELCCRVLTVAHASDY
jgi:hypothetical protein